MDGFIPPILDSREALEKIWPVVEDGCEWFSARRFLPLQFSPGLFSCLSDMEDGSPISSSMVRAWNRVSIRETWSSFEKEEITGWGMQLPTLRPIWILTPFTGS